MHRLAATISLLCASVPCFAASWFVSPNGNDGNPCTSVGSPCLTISHAISLASANDTINIRNDGSGTYTVTTSIANTPLLTFSGFATTPGDLDVPGTGTRPVITTATDNTPLWLDTPGSIFNNLILSTTASSRSTGIEKRGFHGGNLFLNNTKLTGFTKCIDGDNGGATFDWGNVFIFASEIANCSTDAYIDSSNTGEVRFSGSWIHDSAVGIVHVNAALSFDHTTFSAITGTAVLTQSAWRGSAINNNFLNNGTAISTSSFGAIVSFVNNVLYGNTNGFAGGNIGLTQYNACDTEANNPITCKYALTANPFTSSTNFALNNTAGGGALLKNAGFPGVISSSQGYESVGAIQPQGSSGGGGASAFSF